MPELSGLAYPPAILINNRVASIYILVLKPLVDVGIYGQRLCGYNVSD